MTKQEILDRIWNVLNQGVDTESGDLDLLRHDLENDIIEKKDMPGFEGTWKELEEMSSFLPEEMRLVIEQFNKESG